MSDYTSWAGLLTPAPTQFGPDMKQVITLQNLAQQMQARQMVMQQEQQGQNALKQVYSDPKNIDQSGYLTPNAMRGLIMSAPSTGINLMQEMSKARETDLRTKLIGEKVSDEHRNWAIDMMAVPAVARRDEVFKQTGNLQLAQSEGQKAYNEGLDVVKADGRLGAKVSELSPTFDYDRAKANILGRKGIEKAAAEDLKGKSEFTVETDSGKTPPIRYKLYKDGHATDLAGNPYDPTGIAEPKGPEAETFVGTITGPDGKPQSVTVRRSPTGGWIDDKNQPVTQEVKDVHKLSSSGAGAPDEATQDAEADAIGNYQQAPFTGYAARSKGSQEVMAKVYAKYPDYQATRYPEVAKAMRDFGSGKQGDITRSMNVGIDHLRSLDELTDALNTGNVTFINQVANAVKTHLGLSAAPTTFDAAKTVVGSEIIKAVQGAQGALGDREEIRKDLDKRLAPETLKSVTQEYRRLMGGQLRGLERQYEDATGFGPESKFPFRKKLYPETIAELDGAHTPGAPASGAGAASSPPAAGATPPYVPGGSPPAAAFKTPDGKPIPDGVPVDFGPGRGVWRLKNGQPERISP